ncbi:monocarboxylate transporter 8-like [Panulirus ornatus]|uniref:monocarboxylate transporter 8-like n=1 Tax=Panulirus ornatus TaxID=150431 RepID=UPI003A83A7EA
MAMDKVASSPALSMTEGWPDEESALSENEVAALNVALGMGMSVSANTEEAPERHTVADLTSIGPSGRASTLPPGDLMSSVVRLQPVLEASEAVEEGSEGSNAPTDESDQKVASFYIGGDDGFSPREDKVSSPRSSVVGPRLVPLDEGDARGKAIEFTPPDGGYGWVVALSACFINVWIVGFVKSYGVLYVEVRNAFPEASAYHASWLPSLLSTVGLLIGQYPFHPTPLGHISHDTAATTLSLTLHCCHDPLPHTTHCHDPLPHTTLGLAAASAVLTVPHMRSFSGLTVALAMYGFGVGSWFVLIPPILAQHHGAAHLASSYGLVRLFNGLMNFISPQLNGMLYDYTKDYKVLYMFMGSCMVGASLLMVLTPLVLYFRKRDPNQEDEYIIKNPA